MTSAALAGLQIGSLDRVGGISHLRYAEESDRQQASHQNRYEQIPITHEIASHSFPSQTGTVIRD
jgi:hypothetical protein